MRHRNLHSLALSLCLMLAWQAAPAVGQIIVPGADGSDGVFNPTSNITIDLSNAVTGNWDTTPGGDVTGDGVADGVYDPIKFAVVFKYSSVNIPSIFGGVNVTFTNHPSRAPVVWLVGGDTMIDPDAGNVTIDGAVIVRAAASGIGPREPGPGGFRGGAGDPTGVLPGAGFGPGGGPLVAGSARHGSYATLAANESTTYGNARIIPLIGGSGGASPATTSGAGGGGAILIAATGTIALSDTSTGSGIFADGVSVFGSAFGSGGAIRLIANVVTGAAGVLRAQGIPNASGDGRIRIEAVTSTLADIGNPTASLLDLIPGSTTQIWPDAAIPTVRAVSLGAVTVPTDPQASLDFPNADVAISNPNMVELTIEAQNVPVPPNPLAWVVKVRVVRKNGQDSIVPATFVSGTQAMSTWTAHLTLAGGFSAIQVRASAP